MDEDDAFEARLRALYAQAPGFSDADRFSARVDRRLARAFAVRRGLILAAGAAGGLIFAVQILATGLGARLQRLAEDAGPGGAALARAGADFLRLAPAGRLAGLTAPIDPIVIWMGVGLAGLGAALLFGRLLEQR